MMKLRIVSAGILSAALVVGCANPFDGSSLQGKTLRSVDGLDRVEIPLAGTLELREDHGIGGYDQLMVPHATMTFVRGSEHLTTAARRIFLEMVRASLVDAIEAVNLPIVDQPGQCVMEVELAAIGFDLSTERRADQLAAFTMVMQFRDSASGEPLLRYSTKRLIDSPHEGVTHDAKLRAGLDEVVRDLNLASSLRGAGLADDTVRPGCDSTLAQLGRRAQQGR